MLRVGAWAVFPDENLIRCGKREVQVSPRSMDVLCYLSERPETTVSVDELLDAVWPNVVVEEHSVRKAVFELRGALGEGSDGQEYIRTIRKRGYRLVAPVEADVERTAEMSKAPPGTSRGTDKGPLAGSWGRMTLRAWTALVVAVALAAGIGIWLVGHSPPERPVLDLSIAVLPWSEIGDEQSLIDYSKALTDEVRNKITGYQELRLVSVPEANGVHAASYLLGGSVQRVDDQVRLRAQLTRTDDRQTVWAKTFARPLVEQRSDPAELASTVGRFVRLQLVQDQQCESVRRTSSSAEAAAAYCAALAERYRFSQGGDLDLSLELRRAQRALALDPSIADAYRIVALNYTVQGFLGLMDWEEAARQAHAALERGLALAPNDPRLLNVQGELLGNLALDRAAAKANFQASLESDPLHPNAYLNHYGLGELAIAEGNLSTALTHFRRALRLYDSDAAVFTAYASVLYVAGQYRAAVDAADAGLRLVDTGWARAGLLAVKVVAHHDLGEAPQANEVLDDALALPEPMYILAVPLALLGRTDQARQLLAEMEALDHPPIDSLTYSYAELGDDRAYAWILEGIDRHVIGVTNWIRANPNFSNLRNDPRWREVVAHLEAEEAKGRALDWDSE